jgi:AraC family ethanolamine operon transcriptional activator
MEFLRNVRMDQVRNGLLQPGESTSVSGEASRWGFLHFGRFSGEYRETYGELPSETLRRSRKQ